jgi:hypothetical protein
MAANDITASNVSNVSGSSAQTTGRNHDVWGAREVGLYRVTGTNGYVTGGFTFDPKTYGFQGVPAAVFISARNDGTNFLWRWEYNPTTKKIFGIVVTTGAQIASAVDVSTAILDIIVVGE